MKTTEFKLIQRLRSRIPASLREPAGLRDDAAVLPWGREKLLLTTDTLVEGVDFLRRRASPESVGRKALGINLSDMAAMGGEPLYFTVALGIPPGIPAGWLERLYRGIMDRARTFRVICAGGDISAARELFITIGLAGRAGPGKKPVLRNGAKPGDWIGVTGWLGGSILGHHLDFVPRVREGQFLRCWGVRSMIDISDGFLQDLGHILKESGTGAQLEISAIPVSAAAVKKARGHRAKALEYALSDGEDFELLFTASPQKAAKLEAAWAGKFPRVPLSWVGRITARKSGTRWAEQGKPCAAPRLQKKGFQHCL